VGYNQTRINIKAWASAIPSPREGVGRGLYACFTKNPSLPLHRLCYRKRPACGRMPRKRIASCYAKRSFVHYRSKSTSGTLAVAKGWASAIPSPREGVGRGLYACFTKNPSLPLHRLCYRKRPACGRMPGKRIASCYAKRSFAHYRSKSTSGTLAVAKGIPSPREV
jgi:hypothetical protein